MPWSEFPIVPSYPHYPQSPCGQQSAAPSGVRSASHPQDSQDSRQSECTTSYEPCNRQQVMSPSTDKRLRALRETRGDEPLCRWAGSPAEETCLHAELREKLYLCCRYQGFCAGDMKLPRCICAGDINVFRCFRGGPCSVAEGQVSVEVSPWRQPRGKWMVSLVNSHKMPPHRVGICRRMT